ncbi:hypothetical protein [Kitasatospora sp. NPDC097643]|uniref:hypothetical protein n=1 Tax=Kitasatospora sp. NPDC097643 TaxID=3157230 RepID=UPI003329400E
MRPSYDAEHPHSTTPIYDELYSEYRRLFRALPGDRSGEENMKFTGFAVRDGYPLLGEPRPYPPSPQQSFHTYAGQAAGIPQFVPVQQGGPTATHGTAHSTATAAHPPSHTTGHLGAQPHLHAPSHTHTPAHTPTHAQTHPHPHEHTHRHPEPANPTSDGFGQAPAQHGSTPAPHFANGQGWVAAGYLGPLPPATPTASHSMPAPPPAPSPMMGTATGVATAPAPATGGRHRQMLSLPPGRNGNHH